LPLLRAGQVPVKGFENAGETEVEVLLDEGRQFFIGVGAGAEAVHLDAHRPGQADGITEPHFTRCRQPGGHQVLGGVAGGVGPYPVNAQGVFAAQALLPCRPNSP
jgi:hypothetical protein